MAVAPARQPLPLPAIALVRLLPQGQHRHLMTIRLPTTIRPHRISPSASIQGLAFWLWVVLGGGEGGAMNTSDLLQFAETFIGMAMALSLISGSATSESVALFLAYIYAAVAIVQIL